MMADFTEDVDELTRFKRSLERRINEKLMQTEALERELLAIDEKLLLIRGGANDE